MTTPCTQENSIAHITKTLDRMEKSQEDIVDLLKIVSNQTPRLEHLEEHSERTYTELNEVFTRLREIEMTVAQSGPTVRQQFHEAIDSVGVKIDLINKGLDKINTLIRVSTSKWALYAYGVLLLCILTGTALDFTFHRDTFLTVYHFIKG
jgi:DNA repair exonuclease SbcCD ATPase subunit